jgi:hypothetical protein
MCWASINVVMFVCNVTMRWKAEWGSAIETSFSWKIVESSQKRGNLWRKYRLLYEYYGWVHSVLKSILAIGISVHERL